MPYGKARWLAEGVNLQGDSIMLRTEQRDFYQYTPPTLVRKRASARQAAQSPTAQFTFVATLRYSDCCDYVQEKRFGHIAIDDGDRQQLGGRRVLVVFLLLGSPSKAYGHPRILRRAQVDAMQIGNLKNEMPQLLIDMGLAYDPDRLAKVLSKNSIGLNIRALRIASTLGGFITSLLKVSFTRK